MQRETARFPLVGGGGREGPKKLFRGCFEVCAACQVDGGRVSQRNSVPNHGVHCLF